MKLRVTLCTLVLGFFVEEFVNAKANSSLSTHGQMVVTAMGATQKKKFNKEKGTMVLTMGSISFEGFLYDMKNRNKYRACVDLTADMSTVKQQNPVLNSAYLSIAGKFGELQMGNTFSAATELSIDGTQLIGSDGGFSGTTLFSAFNPSAYATIMTGCYYDPGYATQLTYLSPVLKGFQFGLTYVPNSLHLGILAENDSFNPLSNQMQTSPEAMEADAANNIKNKDLMAWGNGGFTTGVIAGGLRYDYGVPHHWNFSLALVGWHGKANADKKIKGDVSLKMKNLNAFGLGFTLGYKHIKFGAGYVNQLKSCLPTARSAIKKEELDKITPEVWQKIVDGQALEASEKGELPGGDLGGLITDNGFGAGANAGQIYTAVLSYLPSRKIKMALGFMYAPRKIASKESTKTMAASFTFDYRVTDGVSAYWGLTYMKTDTCRRAILLAMSEAKSSPAFENNNIKFISAGVKMNF